MKKIIGFAFFLLIGFTSAHANSIVPAKVQISGSVHNILSTQLPTALSEYIKKEYKDYWITELYETGKSKQQSYFITIENEDQIVKLSSDDSENWVIIRTMIKAV